MKAELTTTNCPNTSYIVNGNELIIKVNLDGVDQVSSNGNPMLSKMAIRNVSNPINGLTFHGNLNLTYSRKKSVVVAENADLKRQLAELQAKLGK